MAEVWESQSFRTRYSQHCISKVRKKNSDDKILNMENYECSKEIIKYGVIINLKNTYCFSLFPFK